jgi:hypothetical protein
MNPESPYWVRAGWSTCVGQAETQREQAVQILLNRSKLPEPGGQTGCSLLLSKSSFPLEVVLVLGLAISLLPANKASEVNRNWRRLPSLTGGFFGVDSILSERGFEAVIERADSGQMARQLKQVTQREESTL